MSVAFRFFINDNVSAQQHLEGLMLTGLQKCCGEAENGLCEEGSLYSGAGPDTPPPLAL